MRARKHRARAKQRAVIRYYDARGREVERVVEAGTLPDDEHEVALLAGAGLIEEAPAEDKEEVSHGDA